MGIVISGMTADARFLTKFMRNECMNYEYAHGNADYAVLYFEEDICALCTQYEETECVPK